MLKRLGCLLFLLLLPWCAAAEDALVITPYAPTQAEADFAALLGLDTPVLMYTYTAGAATALRVNVYALEDGAWALADTRQISLPGAYGRLALQYTSMEESLRLSLQSDDATVAVSWTPLFRIAHPGMTFATSSLCEEATAVLGSEIPLLVQCGDETFSLTMDAFLSPDPISPPAYALTLGLAAAE